MRATRSIYLGLALLTCAVLLLQVSLTRVFSLLLWNHYTFLVVSTALLGFGAAGSFVAVRPWKGGPVALRRALARHGLAFAASGILSVMVVSRLGIDPTLILIETRDTAMLPVVYLLTATPFFFAGIAICRVVTACSQEINSIYFADLLGAGAGALTASALLSVVGAPTTILIAATLAACASLAFGGVRPGHGVALAGFAALSVLVYLRDPWTIPVAPSKPLHGNEQAIEFTRWSLHARIDVLESRTRQANFGSGVNEEFFDRPVEFRTFYMDGSNPSRLIRAGQDPWLLTHVLTRAPYSLELGTPRVLIIGSGGGIDTMVARHEGAESVTAVEINPATVALVRDRFGDYIGNVFEQENVRLVAEEGRHFLTLDESRYDLIRLTGVDTRSAAAVGANSLDQAYLYTTEAIGDFYAHLSDDGVLAISRPVGHQTLRLLSVMVASLESRGYERVAERLLVVSNGRWCDVILRRRPYVRDEIDGVRRWAREVGHTLFFDPFQRRGGEADALVNGSLAEREALFVASEDDLTPVTDDRPFFFERNSLGAVVSKLLAGDHAQSSRSGYFSLLMALAQVVVLSVLFVLLPLRSLRGAARASAGGGRTLAYFSLLGLGFVLAELVYIQKYMILLGGPAPAMSVTLFSILVFTGLGSYASRRFAGRNSASLAWAPILAAVALLGSALFLRWGLPQALGYGYAGRVLVSILSLAPVGFALGIPFPLGIRVLDERSPALIPWAWASNACLTVIGSVVCILLSMSFGFSVALFVAIACYLVASLCLLGMIRLPGRA